MKSEEIEQLLYEEESPTLDFKRDQYPFSKATDEEKSELLKDILGFANCFRRTEAIILIGVEEKQGSCSIVHGVSEHLPDHSLQQFINSLTNRPVVFRYDTCEFDGKQVGIIRIGQQRRPVFLKKDYGKLKKGDVYVERGSSTDPKKPADPDEIAMMGVSFPSPPQDASLVVEFADLDTEESLGYKIDWTAEFCTMPTPEEIPDLKEPSNKMRIPGGGLIEMPSASSFGRDQVLNSHFYHEIAHYEFFRRLARRIRLVVTNTGVVPASDVRLEISIPLGEGIWIPNSSEVPSPPKRRTSNYVVNQSAFQNLKPNPIFRPKGYVDIDRNDQRMKIEIECGNLQPGRKVWTDTFDILIGRTGEFKLTGQLFAGNLREPQEFSLKIDATIDQTTMTIDELMSLKDPVDEER